MVNLIDVEGPVQHIHGTTVPIYCIGSVSAPVNDSIHHAGIYLVNGNTWRATVHTHPYKDHACQAKNSTVPRGCSHATQLKAFYDALQRATPTTTFRLWLGSDTACKLVMRWRFGDTALPPWFQPYDENDTWLSELTTRVAQQPELVPKLHFIQLRILSWETEIRTALASLVASSMLTIPERDEKVQNEVVPLLSRIKP